MPRPFKGRGTGVWCGAVARTAGPRPKSLHPACRVTPGPSRDGPASSVMLRGPALSPSTRPGSVAFPGARPRCAVCSGRRRPRPARVARPGAPPGPAPVCRGRPRPPASAGRACPPERGWASGSPGVGGAFRPAVGHESFLPYGPGATGGEGCALVGTRCRAKQSQDPMRAGTRRPGPAGARARGGEDAQALSPGHIGAPATCPGPVAGRRSGGPGPPVCGLPVGGYSGRCPPGRQEATRLIPAEGCPAC